MDGGDADAVGPHAEDIPAETVPDPQPPTKKRKKKDMNAPVLARDFKGRIDAVVAGCVDSVENLNERAAKDNKSYCSVYIVAIVDNRAAGEIQFKQAQVGLHGSNTSKKD